MGDLSGYIFRVLSSYTVLSDEPENTLKSQVFLTSSRCWIPYNIENREPNAFVRLLQLPGPCSIKKFSDSECRPARVGVQQKLVENTYILRIEVTSSSDILSYR